MSAVVPYGGCVKFSSFLTFACDKDLEHMTQHQTALDDDDDLHSYFNRSVSAVQAHADR